MSRTRRIMEDIYDRYGDEPCVSCGQLLSEHEPWLDGDEDGEWLVISCDDAPNRKLPLWKRDTYLPFEDATPEQVAVFKLRFNLYDF